MEGDVCPIPYDFYYHVDWTKKKLLMTYVEGIF